MSSIRPITMPKWGIEMQEGTITGWHKGVGDDVERGEELVDIETDKIVNTVESPASGHLRRILAKEGDVRQVGDLIAVFADAEVADGEIDRFIESFNPADTSFEPGDEKPAAKTQGGSSRDGTGREVRISPIARRLADKLGVDLDGIEGTGRKGRISKADVEAAARAQGLMDDEPDEASEFETIRLTGTQRTAARRLQQAKQEIPHFYLEADIAAEGLRNAADDAGVSINVAVLKAMAMALAAVPEANVQLVDDTLRRFRAVHLGMAVATDRGLLAPVLRNADGQSLTDLAGEAGKLSEKARSGRLAREDLEGGASTVSNLGMFGVDRFSAIVNPPQTTILAIGALQDRPWARDGEVAVLPVLSVTLACDHRAIDGALGARLLAAFRRAVESGLEKAG